SLGQPWSGGVEDSFVGRPVPREQLVEPAGGMLGDAGEDGGQPCLRIDVVELGGDDQAVQEGCALAAAIGAGEQPGLAAQCQAAQRSFSSVVGEAEAAVVQEAGEGGPALEHVVDGASNIAVARQLAPLLAHP